MTFHPPTVSDWTFFKNKAQILSSWNPQTLLSGTWGEIEHIKVCSLKIFHVPVWCLQRERNQHAAYWNPSNNTAKGLCSFLNNIQPASHRPISIHNYTSTPAQCHVAVSLLQAAGPSEKNLYFYSVHELKMASPGVFRESGGFMDLPLSPLH